MSWTHIKKLYVRCRRLYHVYQNIFKTGSTWSHEAVIKIIFIVVIITKLNREMHRIQEPEKYIDFVAGWPSWRRSKGESKNWINLSRWSIVLQAGNFSRISCPSTIYLLSTFQQVLVGSDERESRQKHVVFSLNVGRNLVHFPKERSSEIDITSYFRRLCRST